MDNTFSHDIVLGNQKSHLKNYQLLNTDPSAINRARQNVCASNVTKIETHIFS